ncbi:MAG TPA: hypothetical protein VFU81_00490, partial [Thermomicrobiales bacterium]|nr:hypothetical protein [Thermomicrobiales bacterium]
MESSAPPESAAKEPPRAAGRAASADGRLATSAGPASRADEPKRKRPTAAERRYAGYGDGIERAACAALFH